MQKTYYLIAVAGGSGTRMGAGIPKQFLEIREKAILQRTLEKFIDAWPGVKIITVLPQAHMQTWKDYCLSHNFSYPQQLVPGGITRFHSVRNALAKVPDGAVVAIHDGVRPLLSIKLIRSMFGRMEHCRGLIPVIPVPDTLKALGRVDGDPQGGNWQGQEIPTRTAPAPLLHRPRRSSCRRKSSRHIPRHMTLLSPMTPPLRRRQGWNSTGAGGNA